MRLPDAEIVERQASWGTPKYKDIQQLNFSLPVGTKLYAPMPISDEQIDGLFQKACGKTGHRHNDTPPLVRVFARLVAEHTSSLDSSRGEAPRRKATDEEIAEWVRRHDLEASLKLGSADARAAFEDAESLHLIYGVPARLTGCSRGR